MIVESFYFFWHSILILYFLFIENHLFEFKTVLSYEAINPLSFFRSQPILTKDVKLVYIVKTQLTDKGGQSEVASVLSISRFHQVHIIST